MSQEKNQVLSDDDVNMAHHEEPILDENEKSNKDTSNEGSSSGRENSAGEEVKENSEKDQASLEEEEGEEEEEEEEEEKGSDYEDKSDKEEEYEIEKIVGHRTFKGKVVEYEIKWKGYSEEENTMEKANAIHSDVPDLCEKYWDNLNVKRPSNTPGYGKDEALDRPKKTTKERSTVLGKRSREEEQVERIEGSRLEHVPRCMIDKGFVIPKTYPNEKTKWDSELKQISAVQLSPVDKSIMLTYVEWNNGQRTIHEMSEVHKKCPEALIDYYEARLRFV